MVRSFAAAHPPAWFVDAGALEVMRALFCTATSRSKATVEDLIEALERHGALAVVGGPNAIRALVAPRHQLDRALRELDELLDQLPPVERGQIVRAEDLDDLDELRSKSVEPVVSMEFSPVRLVEQLELFGGGEDDRA